MSQALATPTQPSAGTQDMVFVFGSNLDGMHEGGSARHAYQKLGAEGNTGSCYALPTVGHNFSLMSSQALALHVETFLTYAAEHMEQQFQVTRVGCGIAGFSDAEVATMFWYAPANCQFDEAWKPCLPAHARCWGTF